MDIRTIESVVTSGGLADTNFRIDGDLENVSLAWDEAEETLGVVDYNLNYSVLPWQLYADGVKKVFLTYNGKSAQTGDILETVLLESNNEDDINQIPGYNNSNEWHYVPREFNYPSEFQYLTDPSLYANQPYDYSQGFTVVKQFLTAQANLAPGTPAYTAFYRAPHYTSFIPANVDGNRIYKDGWYTSYVCVVRTWTSVDPVVNGASTGDIVYYEEQKKFYINISGQGGTLIPDPNDPLKQIPDPAHWKVNPTFTEWQTLMRNNLGPTSVNDPIYFIETQHLVTVDLNKAIIFELKKQCNCCVTGKFNASSIDTYMRLVQKRLGAWVQFNEELFHEAAAILETARETCYQCLYHQGECNNC